MVTTAECSHEYGFYFGIRRMLIPTMKGLTKSTIRSQGSQRWWSVFDWYYKFADLTGFCPVCGKRLIEDPYRFLVHNREGALEFISDIREVKYIPCCGKYRFEKARLELKLKGITEYVIKDPIKYVLLLRVQAKLINLRNLYQSIKRKTHVKKSLAEA